MRLRDYRVRHVDRPATRRDYLLAALLVLILLAMLAVTVGGVQ